MTTFLLTVLLLGLAIFGMCFNIIFRKDGKFPEYEVGSNPEMKKLGIRCFKDIDADLHGQPRHAGCTGSYSEACEGCSLHKTENK